MARHVAGMEEKRNANGVQVCKCERMRPIRTPRHRLDKNTKTDPEATEWKIVDWIDLAQDREQWWTAVKRVMKFRNV